MAHVIDPVCGARIDRAAAATQRTVDGRTHYFCSVPCAEQFESHEPPWTTTGKYFTAPKFGSAGSGGAEYEPVPERHKKR